MTSILPKWREIRAEQLYHDLKYAPGNRRPTPPRVKKARRNTKLELADAEIARCNWCGAWTTAVHCTHCDHHGYPIIDDLEKRTS